jgi:mRNA interferase RelE/StbE
MNLKITNQALKAAKKLDAKQFRQVLTAVLGLLDEPEPHDSQALRGAKNGERRIDIGEYRVIYSRGGETVEILVIGPRNDDEVYKIWERKR